jgi:aspartate aminotransferase
MTTTLARSNPTTSNCSPASRVAAMQESASIAIADLARNLQSQGQPVINLAVGEPDFDTPDCIKLAAIDALLRGKTKYTNVDGAIELKTAIRDKLLRENGLHYSDNQISVSSGAKQAIFNALFALLEPGDEVIVPAPYWVSYPEMVRFAGGHPICVSSHAADGYKLTAAALRERLTPAARLLILNSPNNPSGAIYSRRELEAIGEVVAAHPRLLVLCDDIYEHVLWTEEQFCNLAMARPDLADRVVVVNGVSKIFAMTGWRIGYTAGPAWLISAMRKVQGQCTTNATSISQYAAAAALNIGPGIAKSMIQAFQRRQDFMRNSLNVIDGVRCHRVEGTFYAFPNVSGLMARMNVSTDVELAELWLRSANVAVVPGTAYGMPGHLRLSCATSDQTLEEAMTRIAGVSAPSGATLSVA